jgi:hypothetical protein
LTDGAYNPVESREMNNALIVLGSVALAAAALSVYFILEARMYREAFELAKKSLESWKSAAHAWEAASKLQERMAEDLTKKIDAMSSAQRQFPDNLCEECGHLRSTHGERYGCCALDCVCTRKFPV